MTSKPKEPGIVLISGYKRSGKDTTAKMMKEIIEDGTSQKVEILSFAEPLKQIIATLFDISVEELEDFKNDPVNNQLYMLTGYQNYERITDFRVLLMRIGNEAMKPIFGEDVWVKIMKDKIAKSDADVIIIPDFRFLVEDAFKKTNSITIRIKNDNIKNTTKHASETELDNYEFDVILDNTGYKLTKEIIKEEMIKQTIGKENV